MSRPPIYVTRPYLPPLQEFMPFLEEIWKSRTLTNGGPFHVQLEAALEAYLGVPHVSLFANGTIALMTALQALRVSGEVITTPYSFVATSHSLLWNNLKPVFADIDPLTGNIDPRRIELAITANTTAILAVHCYGNPCDVSGIQAVADAHRLKVIYDAAHAFGVEHRGKSLCAYGDVAIMSFHATKVFNTFEGGAIISHDAVTKRRVDHLKNFGFVDETTVVEAGINGKMNEFQAALGLLQLRHLDVALQDRAEVDLRYRSGLRGIRGIATLRRDPETKPNHAYMPVLVTPDYPLSRDTLYQRLKAEGVHPRRYFYPLISSMPMYRDLSSSAPNNLPYARDMADRVICLPIYPELDHDALQRIIDVIRKP